MDRLQVSSTIGTTSTCSSKAIINPYLKQRKRQRSDNVEQQPQQHDRNKSSLTSIDMDNNASTTDTAETTPSSSATTTTDLVVSSKLDADTFSTNINNTSDTLQPATSTSTTNNNIDPSISAKASALIISATDKAGMDGLDRSKIDEIILRESGNSLYMQQQRKRDDKVNQRIQQLTQRYQQASSIVYQPTQTLNEMLQTLQRQAPTRSTCVVIDMDMFYFACELLTRPHLRDRPACVGTGMILTSNYVARKYGVRSAMPGFIGDKLVEELSNGKEQLIHVRSHFDLYIEKSQIVKQVLYEYDPYNMKSYSLDEAYLDIGPYLVLALQHPDWKHELIHQCLLEESKQQQQEQQITLKAMQILQSYSSMTCLEVTRQIETQIRRRVQEKTGGLTCSAGVAPNISLAKIASDKNKPNGQLLVDPSRIIEFVHPLPIRKIPGIGRVTEKILQQVCNVHTVKDLYDQRGLVQWLFQPATSEFLLKASVGCNGSNSITTSDFGMDDEEELGTTGTSAMSSSSTKNSTTDHQKGISRERTFSPETDWAQLNIRLEDIARKLAKDMSNKSVMAHTITVKVKLVSFDVLSRSQSLHRDVYIQDPNELVAITSQLFANIRSQYKKEHSNNNNNKSSRFSVRLLGIRCSNLIDEETYESTDRGLMDRFVIPSSDTLDSESGNEKNNKSLKWYESYLLKKKDQSSTASSPTSTNGIEDTTDCMKEQKGQETEKMKSESTMLAINSSSLFNSVAVTPVEDDEIHQGNVEVHCPLCHRSFSAKDNIGLNAHIDTCLSGSRIRQAIQEENSKPNHDRNNDAVQTSDKSLSNKKQRLTDFWQ